MSDDSGGPTKQQASSDPAPDPQFMKRFEQVIGSWAEATSAGEAESAQAAAMEALSMAAEEELRNPSPDVQLMNEADALESKGDWPAAEALRQKLLALKEPSGNIGMITKAQMDLSGLLRLLGRLDEAWEFACAATVTARQWPKTFALLVIALSNKVSCALERGDSANALAAAAEAVQVIEPGKLHDNLRARALTARAKCLLAQSDANGAGLDLDSAWELLEANSTSRMLPGIVAALANWWEAKSKLEEQLGNHFRAREAITLAIEYRRQFETPYARLALARALEKLGEFSRAAGDKEAEERQMSEAKSIREGLHLPAGAHRTTAR
jgi:hypothetical protein